MFSLSLSCCLFVSFIFLLRPSVLESHTLKFSVFNFYLGNTPPERRRGVYAGRRNGLVRFRFGGGVAAPRRSFPRERNLCFGSSTTFVPQSKNTTFDFRLRRPQGSRGARAFGAEANPSVSDNYPECLTSSPPPLPPTGVGGGVSHRPGSGFKPENRRWRCSTSTQ